MLGHISLTTTNFVIAWAILLLLTISFYFIQSVRYELRIRKIGGGRAPLLAGNPFTSTRWFIKCGKAQMNHRLLEYFTAMFSNGAHTKPSDIVEIQVKPFERYLITRDPEHIKTILAGKFASFGKGTKFHELWSPFLGDSIFTTDGALWHDSRSLIRPMFIKDRVSDLAIFERWTKSLIEKIDEDGGPGDGKEVEIMDLFYRLTLDVTTDFLLGASVNSLANPRAEFAEAFNEVQSIQMFLTMLGPFQALLPRGRYRRGIRVIDRFVMPYIEAALAMPPPSPAEPEKHQQQSDRAFTFLHNIAAHTRDPHVLRDQIVAVLLAGRDTTAATLSWAVYELSRCPERWARLRNEVRDALGAGDGRAPSYDDLKNMTYLRHVLAETLRLYPAVPYNLRSALEDTTLPNGGGGGGGGEDISVVQGDIVVYSTLAMQRCEGLYPRVGDRGELLPDPAVFAPERWENWAPRPWTYVPFNGGPRICVGQNFAMTEMAYVLVRLVQSYDRLEYCGDWNAQYHEAEIVGRPGRGVRVKLWKDKTGRN